MIYLIISVIALLAVIMYDYSWSNVTSDDRNDLIFDGKNKAYGAYEMRRNYSRKMFFSLIGVMITLTAAISAPKMFAWDNSTPEAKNRMADIKDIEILNDEKPKEEIEIPKIEPPVEQPPVDQPELIEMVKSPKPIAADIVVDPPKTNEELANKNLGPKDQKGKDSIVEYVKVEVPPLDPVDPILTIAEVQEQPEFDDLGGYLRKHVKYPAEAKEMDIQGTVYVTFIIDEKGKVKVTGLKKSVHELLDDEAKRVVAGMPNWKPAQFNGKPVKVRMTLPLKFKLAANN